MTAHNLRGPVDGQGSSQVFRVNGKNPADRIQCRSLGGNGVDSLAHDQDIDVSADSLGAADALGGADVQRGAIVFSDNQYVCS